MTDLTYCYLHMSKFELLVLDTIDTVDHMDGEFGDKDIDVPEREVPPDPDDSDILPSQVHPSYPYGNPTNIKHPASKARLKYEPSPRALFEDMAGDSGSISGALRWQDLALNDLLPIDEEKEAARKAFQARKMASGASNNNPPGQQQQQQAPQAQQGQADDEDDDDDDDIDENDIAALDDEDEDEEDEEEDEEEESEGGEI